MTAGTLNRAISLSQIHHMVIGPRLPDTSKQDTRWRDKGHVTPDPDTPTPQGASGRYYTTH